MRLVKTFILHLYVDTNVLERLCGDVRSLEEKESTSFKDKYELERLLHRCITKSLPPPVSQP